MSEVSLLHAFSEQIKYADRCLESGRNVPAILQCQRFKNLFSGKSVVEFLNRHISPSRFL